MKNKYKIILSLCFLLTVTFFIAFSITSKGNDEHGKIDAVKKFYTSYENKDINLFNASVVDSLKIVNQEDIVQRNLFYGDIKSFKVNNITADTESSITSFNGVTYDKDNIAVFNINYDIDFHKDIYGTSDEGSSFVRKVIIRENSTSPWLVAGNLDGHGY